jgi:hypothetical protein
METDVSLLNQTEQRWVDGQKRYLLTDAELNWLVAAAFAFGAGFGAAVFYLVNS